MATLLSISYFNLSVLALILSPQGIQHHPSAHYLRLRPSLARIVSSPLSPTRSFPVTCPYSHPGCLKPSASRPTHSAASPLPILSYLKLWLRFTLYYRTCHLCLLSSVYFRHPLPSRSIPSLIAHGGQDVSCSDKPPPGIVRTLAASDNRERVQNSLRVHPDSARDSRRQQPVYETKALRIGLRNDLLICALLSYPVDGKELLSAYKHLYYAIRPVPAALLVKSTLDLESVRIVYCGLLVAESAHIRVEIHPKILSTIRRPKKTDQSRSIRNITLPLSNSEYENPVVFGGHKRGDLLSAYLYLTCPPAKLFGIYTVGVDVDTISVVYYGSEALRLCIPRTDQERALPTISYQIDEPFSTNDDIPTPTQISATVPGSDLGAVHDDWDEDRRSTSVESDDDGDSISDVDLDDLDVTLCDPESPYRKDPDGWLSPAAEDDITLDFSSDVDPYLHVHKLASGECSEVHEIVLDRAPSGTIPNQEAFERCFGARHGPTTPCASGLNNDVAEASRKAQGMSNLSTDWNLSSELNAANPLLKLELELVPIDLEDTTLPLQTDPATAPAMIQRECLERPQRAPTAPSTLTAEIVTVERRAAMEIFSGGADCRPPRPPLTPPRRECSTISSSSVSVAAAYAPWPLVILPGASLGIALPALLPVGPTAESLSRSGHGAPGRGRWWKRLRAASKRKVGKIVQALRLRPGSSVRGGRGDLEGARADLKTRAHLLGASTSTAAEDGDGDGNDCKELRGMGARQLPGLL